MSKVAAIKGIALRVLDFVFRVPIQEEKERKQRHENHRQKFKLTHENCSGDAFPMAGSVDGYRCEKCGVGFRSVVHRLWVL